MKDEKKAVEASNPSFILPPLSLAFIVLYVLARLWRLNASCLWFDEIFSVHAARHTWAGLWHFVAADLIHPPLFYALLKLWIAAGGESLGWLRLFPALTSIAALVPFFLLARELRTGTKATTLALVLLASNGYLIKYAQELRMYSLMLLLTLTTLWLFTRLLNNTRASKGLLLALFFVNLLLVYTHYYGWLVVACEALLLLYADRKKLRAFLLVFAGLLFCFAPWMFACLQAARTGGGLAQNVGWIERPGASDLTQFYALLNEPFYFRQSSAEPPYARGGAILGLLFLGVPVLLLLFKCWRQRRASLSQEEPAHAEDLNKSVGPLGPLLFFTLAPVVLAFVASRVLPYSVWGTRHLIIVAAPYTLLCGVALARTRPAWLKSSLLLLLACWLFSVGALTLVRHEGAYIWCAWGDLAASAARDEEAEAKTSAGDARPANVQVFAFEDLVAYHLWFALEGRKGARVYLVSSLKGVPGVKEDPAYFLPRDFDEVRPAPAESFANVPRFWAAFRDTTWDESRPPLNFILPRGYHAARVYETSAQGQRAFLVLFEREGNPPKP